MRTNLKRDGTKTIELRKDEQGALKYARVIVRELSLHGDGAATEIKPLLDELCLRYAPLAEVEE